MTNELAITLLSEYFNWCPDCINHEHSANSKERGCDECMVKATEVAIKALEKQIPKIPILNHDVTNVLINNGELHYEWKQIEKYNWHCPVCNGVVGERIILPKGKVHDQKMKMYCEKCGQRLE